MEEGVLNNREMAGLIWLVVLAVYVLWQPGRAKLLKSLGAAAGIIVTPKLLVPLVTYVGWLVGAVWLANRVGLWDAGLLKPTLLWGIFAGIALFFSWTKALDQEAFFKSALLAAIGVSIFVEFFVSFQSFPFAVELVVQPLVALAAMLAIVAERKPGQEIVVKAANAIIVGFGLVALVWVAWNVITRWTEIDGVVVVKEVLMPVWLAPIALAYVYVLAIYAGYEQAFKRIDWKADGRSTWRQKAAFLSVAGFRLKRLRRLNVTAQMRVAEETSFKSARRALALADQE